MNNYIKYNDIKSIEKLFKMNRDDYILEHASLIDWNIVSKDIRLSEEQILKFKSKLNVNLIVKHQHMSNEFYYKNFYPNEMHDYSINNAITEDFLNKYDLKSFFPEDYRFNNSLDDYIHNSCVMDKVDSSKYISINAILKNNKYSETFLNKYYKLFSDTVLYSTQDVSESFIKKHFDSIGYAWRAICERQLISEDFVINNFDKFGHALVSLLYSINNIIYTDKLRVFLKLKGYGEYIN